MKRGRDFGINSQKNRKNLPDPFKKQLTCQQKSSITTQACH